MLIRNLVKVDITFNGRVVDYSDEYDYQKEIKEDLEEAILKAVQEVTTSFLSRRVISGFNVDITEQ